MRETPSYPMEGPNRWANVVQHTKARRNFIVLNTLIRRMLRGVGLSVHVDVEYGMSWFLGLEDLPGRIDPERGRSDAETIMTHCDSNSVLLDMGCGAGRVEKFLADSCKEIHGIDISRTAVRTAQRYLLGTENAFFQQGDASDLSMFPDETFDLVFSLGTLHHMAKEDVFCALVEAHRTLKRDGFAYLEFQNLLTCFDQFAYNALSGDRTRTRMRYHTIQEVETTLSLIGFEIEAVEGTHHGESIRVWAERRRTPNGGAWRMALLSGGSPLEGCD